MSKFKAGQKVRVIRAIQTVGLAVGAEVRVSHLPADTDSIHINDLNGNLLSSGDSFGGYFVSRFEAVVEQLDFSKPLQTSDGREVTLVTTTARGAYPVLAYIEDSDAVSSFTSDGKFYGGAVDPRDLMNAPEKPATSVAYVNVYKNRDGGVYGGDTYSSAESADSAAHYATDRVGRVKITLTEGQYDD